MSSPRSSRLTGYDRFGFDVFGFDVFRFDVFGFRDRFEFDVFGFRGRFGFSPDFRFRGFGGGELFDAAAPPAVPRPRTGSLPVAICTKTTPQSSVKQSSEAATTRPRSCPDLRCWARTRLRASRLRATFSIESMRRDSGGSGNTA